MTELPDPEQLHLVAEDYAARMLALTVEQLRTTMSDIEKFTSDKREGVYYNLDDVLSVQMAAFIGGEET